MAHPKRESPYGFQRSHLCLLWGVSDILGAVLRQCRDCGSTDVGKYGVPVCANHHKGQGRSQESRMRKQQGRWLKRYSLTVNDYDALLQSQDGKCAVCRSDNPGVRGWHIDHDHTCCNGRFSCGRCVRGLLCGQCNLGLGIFQDDPERLLRARDYLVTHQG